MAPSATSTTTFTPVQAAEQTWLSRSVPPSPAVFPSLRVRLLDPSSLNLAKLCWTAFNSSSVRGRSLGHQRGQPKRNASRGSSVESDGMNMPAGDPARAHAPPRGAAVAGVIFSVLMGTSLIIVRLATPAYQIDPGAWLNDPTRRLPLGLRTTAPRERSQKQ